MIYGVVMYLKNYLIFFSFFMIVFSCLNTANAIDNVTIIGDANIIIDNQENELFDDEIVYETISETDTFNISESECCSFVIQENGRTVYGFRQDGAMKGHGLEINALTWNGLNVLKQEIDTGYEYFSHCIITENGWVIGQGGSQYNQSCKNIEQLAAKMISSNDISPVYLKQIKDILSRYNYGHFLIKAPDGRYGASFSNTYLTGTLNVGQYLIVPNYYSYYKKGSYSRYSSNPVDAIVLMCSYESSGYHRKNLMTYDYNVKETSQGVFYGIDVYATNDNGRNVGLDTSKYVTHFFYKGQYYPPSVIPQNPSKMYVATHIFESQYFGNSIELIECTRSVLIGEGMSAHFKIKHLFSEKTVVFNLGNEADFVTASVSHGSFTYDSQNHLLYWTIPAINQEKDIMLTIKPKSKGYFNLNTHITGMTENHNVVYYVTEQGVNIDSANFEKYKGGAQNLNIYLKDKNRISLMGEKVAILINGITYYRQVPAQGFISFPVNLNPGEYDVKIWYDGKFGKNQTTAHITIKSTLFGSDIVKYYKNDTQFYASFLDGNGNPLKNANINFNINGVIYTRMTDGNGVAKLNINLSPNKYIITSINLATGEQKSNYITVKHVLTENKDLIKYYKNDSQYTLKILDGQGKPLSGAKVTFNINGVFYDRISNKNGYVKLNINLAPGNYIITASYNGYSVSNNIRVLSRLLSDDMNMNYKDGSTFKVSVLDETGNIITGENVTFNINGVFYNRTVGENGFAKLNINLMPGKYIITSYWRDCIKSNIITIKS